MKKNKIRKLANLFICICCTSSGKWCSTPTTEVMAVSESLNELNINKKGEKQGNIDKFKSIHEFIE